MGRLQVVPRDQLSDDSDSDMEEEPAPPPQKKDVDEYAGMDEETKARLILEKVRRLDLEWECDPISCWVCAVL